MHFKNKTALVTGASRGIGKAIALELARGGAAVIVHYHTDKEEAENVLRQIEQLGAKGTILQANFENPAEAIKLGERAWGLYGRVDYLVNNAGVSYKKHFLDQTEADLDYFFAINFKSAVLLTQTIARKMVRQQVAGSIYTITSINGLQPGVGLSLYGASKGAAETAMKGIALELAPHNITVNTVAVGAVATDMNAALKEDAAKLALVNNNIPMKRMAEPEEIANAVVALLAAGSYITGSTIKIDGGWLLKTGFANPEKYTGSGK